GRIDSIDAAAASENWSQVFVPEILAGFTGDDGHLYGVPQLIERDNTMFYNRKILQQAGVAPPETIADWFVAAAALKAGGATPLAVSALGGWTIASHLFEGILVAEAGPNFYVDYMRGAKTGDAPEIEQALTDLGSMMDYANGDRATAAWADALTLVCKGYAPMMFISDFAQA